MDTPMGSPAATRLAEWADALFPPDPGWLRRREAARATASGVLTWLLAGALSQAMAVPMGTRIFGFTMGLLLGALVHDPTPRRQAWTTLLCVPAGLAAASLAVAARPVPLLADAAMVVVAALAAWLPSRGPRWAAVATVILIGYVMNLVMRTPPPALAATALVLALAAVVALLLRLVLWPERQAVVLALIVAALRARMAAILGLVGAAVARGGWSQGERRQLRRQVARLNEALLMAEGKLGPPTEGGPGMVLLELALATERAVWLAGDAAADQDHRPAVLARIVRLRAALTGPGGVSGGPPQAPPDAQPGPAPSKLVICLAGLERLLLAPAPLADAGATPLPDPPPGPAGPALRQALQAALAVAAAITGGLLIAPQRWYWAGFAALVAFQGTASAGQTVARSWQFMLGTAAGAAAGAAAASLLSPYPAASFVAVVACVFAAFAAGNAAYGVMVFWVTVVLALMFGMLGYFAPELMLLRLEEAAWGSACGVAVGCLVLATRTGDAVAAAERDYLAALATLVAASVDAVLGAPGAATLQPALTLEGRHQALAAAMGPLFHGPLAIGRPAVRRRWLLLDACHFWARELAEAARAPGAPASGTIADTLRAAAALVAAAATGPVRGAPQPEAPAAALGTDRAAAALRLLLRLEAALGRLRRA